MVNIAVVLGFDAAVLYFCGFKALIYLLLGTVMGGGMHPMAGHLISEHYMFIKVRQQMKTSSCAHNFRLPTYVLKALRGVLGSASDSGAA